MTAKAVTIEIREVPGTENAVVLHFSGDLISDSVQEINHCFLEIEKRVKPYTIVDMTNVSLLSSAALGEFMGCRQRLIEKDGDLVFSSLNLEMRSKFNLMGANKVFQTYNDNRSALNSYKWRVERQPEKIQISFPPFLKIVPPLRQLVSRIARQKGYGNRDSFRIETIIDEICNNAVEHGKRGKDELIDLTVTIDPDKIEIDVKNISDPDKVASLKAQLALPHGNPVDSTNEKRGRGLTLVKMLTDELSVNCTEQGTSVHVKKVREE